MNKRTPLHKRKGIPSKSWDSLGHQIFARKTLKALVWLPLPLISSEKRPYLASPNLGQCQKRMTP